jgi:hypothetical protein
VPNPLPDETFFNLISDVGEATPAPRSLSRLKSRIYSALVRRQQETGSLLSLSAIAGADLCIFEKLVQISPVPEAQKCFNLCSVCHARLLGERIESPPIFWANCPYVEFKKS